MHTRRPPPSSPITIVAVAMTTSAAGTAGARWRSRSIAARERMPVTTGAAETSGKCCKMCQSFVKKLPDAPKEFGDVREYPPSQSRESCRTLIAV
jgi:hypothetical protein